jgi:hypothetical protein
MLAPRSASSSSSVGSLAPFESAHSAAVNGDNLAKQLDDESHSGSRVISTPLGSDSHPEGCGATLASSDRNGFKV